MTMNSIGIFMLVFFSWTWLSRPQEPGESIGACIVAGVLGAVAAIIAGGL